jgi:hypothetical protein
MFKAYDMDGQRLSLYHPGMTDPTKNRTARCWNGDVDELGLWDETQVGTSPRYECVGGTRNGESCIADSECLSGAVCAAAWVTKICTHAKTCFNVARRCNVDTDCGTGPTAKCIAPPFKGATGTNIQGKPLPFPILGQNCSTDRECEFEEKDGLRILGRCSATWSLCREQFDFDRVSQKDLNRAGFLIKLDYDWINQNDLGSNNPALFATAGWTLPGALASALPEDRFHSTWMQHVIGVADIPFLDVDNPLDWKPMYAGAVRTGRDVVTDHIAKNPSLVDPQRVNRAGENRLATAATASAMTQQIFSTFPCYSGSSNAPPEFFSSSSPDTATRFFKTDIECKRIGACIVDLHIIDYVIKSNGKLDDPKKIATDRVAIEMALGTGRNSQKSACL